MRRAWLWLRSVFLRARLDREMRDEMTQHIERAIARNIAGGMTPQNASRAAHREFGNVDVLHEHARDARGKRWLDAVKGDMRFAARHFRRTPLSTATMVLVLALGIGMNTVAFTTLQLFLVAPPAGVTRNESLAHLRGLQLSIDDAEFDIRRFAYPETQQYAAQSGVFSDVAVWTTATVTLHTANSAQPYAAGSVAYVSENYFDVLGVRFARGTFPRGSETATQLPAVINERLWRAVFDSASDVIGRSLRINDVVVTIAGVVPGRFAGVGDDGDANRVWLPLHGYDRLEKSSGALSSPDSALFWAAARLQPGVTHARATAAAKAVAVRASRERAQTSERSIASADVVPLRVANITPMMEEDVRLMTAGLSALAILILLVTCTNVSSLLTGMAVARRREIAVRLSLGAGRRRLIAQLLTECLFIAVLAAAVAAVVTGVLAHVVATRFPELLLEHPLGEELRLSWRSAAWTSGIALATTLLFGLSPALHATRLALADVLKDSVAGVSGSRSRLQRILVVAQVTLTQPLLVAVAATALLAVDDLRRMAQSDIDERLVMISFSPMWDRRGDDRTRLELELQRMQDRLSAVPGVAGVTTHMSPRGEFVAVHPDDRITPASAADRINATGFTAPPGALAVREIAIVRGRDFDPAEMDSTMRAVIIDDEFARRLFGGVDAVGRRLRVGRDSAWSAIVGIADAERARVAFSGTSKDSYVFMPRSSGVTTTTLTVRTRGPGADLMPALRTAAQGDAQLALGAVRTIAESKAKTRRMLTQVATIFSGAGMLALLLGAIGLYAIVVFAVNQRRREIGIRTALGATPRQVVGVFFLSGLRLSMLGLVLGLPLSIFGARMIMVNDIGDQLNYLVLASSIALGVLAIASLATWLPARRAAGVDPLQSLRSE